MTIEVSKPAPATTTVPVKKVVKSTKNSNPTTTEVVPSVEPTTEVVPDVDPRTQMQDSLAAFELKLRELKALTNALTVEYTQMRKICNTAVKSLKKRKRNSSGTKTFKPVVLTKELAKFCKTSDDSEMTRGSIIQYIFKYAKQNSLYFDELPKNVIKPDKTLTKLLGPFDLPIQTKKPELGNGLSMYNIQTYLKRHFNK